MSPLRFAWKSLGREPLRSLLAVAGVAAVAALLLNMLLLSRGLLLSFEDVLASTGYEVRVTATRALPGIGPLLRDVATTVGRLESLPEIDEVLALRFAAGAVDMEGGSGTQAQVMGAGPGGNGGWTLLEGRDFRVDDVEPPEAVLSHTFAEELGWGPGDIIRLRPGADSEVAAPPRELRVVGIARFPFDMVDQYTVATTLRAVREAGLVRSSDRADLLLVAPAAGVSAAEAVAAIRAARPDLHPFSIEDFLERFEATDFSYFRQISFVLSSVTGFFAFLLVTAILTVSVNQRIGEVAALRALGFSRGRVAADLAAEALLLTGLGGVLSIPAGLALARILDDILRQMPGLPERLHFFVLTPRAILMHAGLLAVTAGAAAVWPVLLAARLSIADTLRREVVG